MSALAEILPIAVTAVVTGIVTSFIFRWATRVESRRAALRAAEAATEFEAAQRREYQKLRDQLREPVEWVIVATPDPGVGVVLMVAQQPVKFDMLRRMDPGKWQAGPLGAKLPVYTLVFGGQSENFLQVRGDTYEDALRKLMAQRAGGRQES